MKHPRNKMKCRIIQANFVKKMDDEYDMFVCAWFKLCKIYQFHCDFGGLFTKNGVHYLARSILFKFFDETQL